MRPNGKYREYFGTHKIDGERRDVSSNVDSTRNEDGNASRCNDGRRDLAVRRGVGLFVGDRSMWSIFLRTDFRRLSKSGRMSRTGARFSVGRLSAGTN